MLTQAAQLYRQTGDAALLLTHSQKLVDISDMLIARRRKAQTLPADDPSYGMIRGQDESDVSTQAIVLLLVTFGAFLTDHWCLQEILVGWTQNTTELPHISFSLEAWRGFRDLGAVWQEIGVAQRRPDLASVGAALMAEAPLLLRDVGHAMRLSVVPANSSGLPPCHPYVAGEESCSLMSTAHVSGTSGPYNSRAQEPWRTYSGMFWSGGLSAQDATEIVEYNQNNDRLSRFGVWCKLTSNQEIYDRTFFSEIACL